MAQILVVGGSSGLGLELAKLLSAAGNKAVITGRRDPKEMSLEFKKLDLSADIEPQSKSLIKSLPRIDILIYAAGYYQEGRITDLTEKEIEEMINVGGRGLIYLVRDLLTKQKALKELITITSSSQWTPRTLEPIYNFVKAGAGHLSNALAEDGRIEKVMVVGPAGMRTRFWEGIERNDLAEMLDPNWVANQIMELREGDFTYKFIKIMRQPSKVEIVETR